MRVNERALQRNFNLCIPRKGTARPLSQFLHSCVCERFIYSHQRFINFPAAEKENADQSWGYINRTQKHEYIGIGNVVALLFWEYCFKFSVQDLCSVFRSVYSHFLLFRCSTGEAWPDIMMSAVSGRPCDPRAHNWNYTKVMILNVFNTTYIVLLTSYLGLHVKK